MSKTITIRVPDDLYENLVQQASKNGIGISTLIRTRLQEDSMQPKEHVLLKNWNGEQRKKRRVSLSDTELEVLTQNAERFGLSRSAYVRSRCVYKPGTYVEVDRGLLGDCFRELRRQGVNLNQIAKEINSAARVARAADAVSRLRPEIEACLKEISEATRRFIHVMSGVEHNEYK